MRKDNGKYNASYSPFTELEGIEYFRFEEDFVEENIRCIPMIVRFKMDAAGIKLKLAEWSKFGIKERQELAIKYCSSAEERDSYQDYLENLVRKYTGAEATRMNIEEFPLWADRDQIPPALSDRMKQEALNDLSISQWRILSNLQRFALLKLCRPGHESRNFRIALKEFKLV